MPASERVYCSEQNPNEPMIGTADPVDVWVLLEYRPAWKVRAIEQSELGAEARRWLDDGIAALARAGLKARPQLIRQPELDRDGVELFVARPGALMRFGGSGYDFLADLDLTDIAAHPERYPPLTEPHYFVCTNGQRDACCARFGLPLYAELRARLGARVWQTTHLGGHRFAPNVLALPQGAVYGRVGEAVVDDFIGTVEGGALAFDLLRGRAWLPPAAQAAEALCRRNDLRFDGMSELAEGVSVAFTSADGPLSVVIRQAEPLTVLKSCGDAEPAPVRPFQPA